MKTDRFEQTFISPDIVLKEAIKHMDKAALQLLMVVDEKGHLLGIVTDGDIRRALLKGIDFKAPISSFMSRSPHLSREGADKGSALALMKAHSIRHVPVVDEHRKVVGLYLTGMTLDEITAVMNWKKSRTNNLFYRGLEDLKRILAAEGDSHEGSGASQGR